MKSWLRLPFYIRGVFAICICLYAKYLKGHLPLSDEVTTEYGQFNEPTSIALDSSGNVYVVDRENTRIQVFAPS